MENASKALLIAGSILVVILLISIGVIIVNFVNTDEVGEQTEAWKIEQFNAQFLNFEGTSVSGSNVKSLFNKINSSNASSDNDIEIDSSSSANITKSSKVSSNKKYTVEFTYGDTGYINSVKITENK